MNFNIILKICYPTQYGFQKRYSKKHCLLVVIEQFKETANGAPLLILSNGFDFLDHSLLWYGKLHWYGLSPLSLNLIFSYFSSCTHSRTLNNRINRLHERTLRIAFPTTNHHSVEF